MPTVSLLAHYLRNCGMLSGDESLSEQDQREQKEFRGGTRYNCIVVGAGHAGCEAARLRQGEHRGQRRGMTHGEESKRCFLEVAPYVSRSVPGMDALPWWKNAAS